MIDLIDGGSILNLIEREGSEGLWILGELRLTFCLALKGLATTTIT